VPRLPDPRFGPSCHVVVDGRRVPAREGESVARALVAAGRPLVARSAKYHRPRGPFCLAGSCGSCLARVDGLPNRRLCRTPCREGLAVETQNAILGAGHDLLAVVDRVYPHGLDHHGLATWSRLANRAAVAVARQLAGLGKLPSRLPDRSPPVKAERFDALVVGAGPAGLGAAEVLAAGGRRVLVVEEEPAPGGRLRCRLDLPGDPAPGWVAEVAAAVARAGGEVALATSALGLWDDGGPLVPLAATSPHRLRLVRAPLVVLATGTSPQPPVFDDADLPGVFAARGLAAALAEDGVVAGERAAVLGEGAEAEAVARVLGAAGMAVARAAAPRAAHGKHRVEALLLDAAGRRIECDTVACAGALSPAAELARGAGARLAIDAASGGLRLADAGPRIAPGVVVAGEVVAPMGARAAADSGRRAAEAGRG
jgi:sarcosine oxidase subunit alpha